MKQFCFNSESECKDKHQLAEKLVNELVALESLKESPRVLRFEEFIKTDNNFWLVTEFCNGGSLFDYIGANPNGMSPSVLKNLSK